jgi:hypothetical protein
MKVKLVKQKKVVKQKKARVIQKNKGRGPNININIDQSKKTTRAKGSSLQKPQIITTVLPSQAPPPPPAPFNFPLPTNLNPFDTVVKATQKESEIKQPNELEKPKPKEKEKETSDDESVFEMQPKATVKKDIQPKYQHVDLRELEQEYEAYTKAMKVEPKIELTQKLDESRIRTPIERGSTIMTIQDLGKPKEKKNVQPSFEPFKGKGNVLDPDYVYNMEREMTNGKLEGDVRRQHILDDMKEGKNQWVEEIEKEFKKKNEDAALKKKVIQAESKLEILSPPQKKELKPPVQEVPMTESKAASATEDQNWHALKKSKYTDKLDNMDLEELKEEAKKHGIQFTRDKESGLKQKLLNRFDEQPDDFYKAKDIFSQKDVEKYKKLTSEHKKAEEEKNQSTTARNLQIDEKSETLLKEDIEQYIRRVGKDELRGDMRYFSSSKPELNPRKNAKEYRTTPENKALFKEFLLTNPKEFKNLRQYKGGKNKE